MPYPDGFSSRAFNRYWDRPPAPARTRAERLADVYSRYSVEQLKREAVRLAVSTMAPSDFNDCIAAVQRELQGRGAEAKFRKE